MALIDATNGGEGENMLGKLWMEIRAELRRRAVVEECALIAFSYRKPTRLLEPCKCNEKIAATIRKIK